MRENRCYAALSMLTSEMKSPLSEETAEKYFSLTFLRVSEGLKEQADNGKKLYGENYILPVLM